jgi:hypothetical protein
MKSFGYLKKSYSMKDSSPYPEFITPLMKMWYAQKKSDRTNDITVLGLFDWIFKSNKRNPKKLLRLVNVKHSVRLKDSSNEVEYYFFEVDNSTLHVYEVTGFSRAGYSVANEYFFKDESFTDGVKLFSKIS